MAHHDIHHRQQAALQQMTFPRRRHLAQSRRLSPLPLVSSNSSTTARNAAERSKRQSTLTQIDFVTSTPLSAASGDEESDYDAQERKRTAKRSRRSESGMRKTDQSTLTQKWDAGTRRAEALVLVDDSTDDDDITFVEDSASEAPDHRRSTPITSPVKSSGDVSGQQIIFSTMVAPKLDAVPQASNNPTKRRLRKMQKSSGHDDGSAGRSALLSHRSNNVSLPSTPHINREKEIPSSQTPASIKLSAHCSPTKREQYNRSPLRELPQNSVRSSASARRSSRLAAKANKPTSSQDSELTPTRISSKIGRDRSSLGQNLPQQSPSEIRAPPPLIYTRTVQDSQQTMQTLTRDTPTKVGKQDVAEYEGSRRPVELQSASPQASVPMPALLHTTTVQDSQQESDDLDIVKHHSSVDKSELSSELGTDPSRAFTQYPQTYDPVFAALERDAARFMNRTQQTQAPLGGTFPSDEEVDNETQDLIAAPAIPATRYHYGDIATASTDRNTDRVVPSSPEADASWSPPLPVTRYSSVNTTAAADDRAVLVPSSPLLGHDRSIPDSPTAVKAIGKDVIATPRHVNVRASQASTVVSSPAAFLSRLRGANAHSHIQNLASPQRNRPPPMTLDSMPTLAGSSSPIILPPWTEEELAARERQALPELLLQSGSSPFNDNDDDDDDNDDDESLPRPPGY